VTNVGEVARTALPDPVVLKAVPNPPDPLLVNTCALVPFVAAA
jgi:hypothetical protein